MRSLALQLPPFPHALPRWRSVALAAMLCCTAVTGGKALADEAPPTQARQSSGVRLKNTDLEISAIQ